MLQPALYIIIYRDAHRTASNRPYRVKKHPKHSHQPPNIALTSHSKTDRGYKTASSPP